VPGYSHTGGRAGGLHPVAAAFSACQVAEKVSSQIQAVVSQLGPVSGFAGRFIQAARAAGRVKYHQARAG
jgi:hypothetical protein